MNETQLKFIELSKHYEAIKKQLQTAKTELVEKMVEIGIGNHFQDPEDKTVFQIVKPAGTFISFDTIGYERTRREGEKTGSMSIKAAEELGYSVK